MMKWFRRRLQVETSVEDIMVSFWRGSEMVEAGFVKLRLTNDGRSYTVGFAEPTTVSMPESIDRMVYELPNGCFEKDLAMDAGWVITWSVEPPAVGVETVPIRLCQRTMQAREMAQEAAGARKHHFTQGGS